MNTIPGEQWFQPLPFARFSQPAGGRAVGGRPAPDAGRYARAAPLLAVARRDYDAGTDRLGRAHSRSRISPHTFFTELIFYTS